MSCSRCGSDCDCSCSGNLIPVQDWRRQVALQVRAHKVRKRRRMDPDSPLLDFEEQEPLIIESPVMASRRAARQWSEDVVVPTPDCLARPEDVQHAAVRHEIQPALESSEFKPICQPQMQETSDSFAAVISERPPLPPFPRMTTPAPKIIEFPRMHVHQYELAEPVADQLRIFEAVEDHPLPAVNHLSEIEIAPEEPVHFGVEPIEIPIQAAPLQQRAYAAVVDGIIVMGAIGVFGFCAKSFASSLPAIKPLLESGAICGLLLLTMYYLLSFSVRRSTAGMQASGLRVITFSGSAPSCAILRCRALATVLSFAALGMGLAWSFIDEDRLCWHDRITHTYLTAE